MTQMPNNKPNDAVVSFFTGNGFTWVPSENKFYTMAIANDYTELTMAEAAFIYRLVTETKQQVTFDDFPGYWNDKDQHVRHVVAIKDGQILKNWKVTDDELIKYGEVGPYGLCHAQIEAYGRKKLTQGDNDE